MSHAVVERLPDGPAAARRAAELLAAAVIEALAQRGAAHIALSGGHTPRATYARLGTLLPRWDGVHVWFADERCVGPDHPDANALLVRETLDAPGAVVHRMQGELGAEAGAHAYERELGDIVLDAVLLGLGEDGHTASLFPGEPGVHERARKAIAAHAPAGVPERITLSAAYINRARRVWFLVSGAGKAGALARVLAGPEDHDLTPAQAVARHAPDVEFFVDAAAFAALALLPRTAWQGPARRES